MAEVNKVIGLADYWCRCCAHCESVELGCMDDVPIYICTDPYDGVEKRIPGNETITCTMFNLANEVPVFNRVHCDTKTDIIYEDDKVRAIKVTGWGDDVKKLSEESRIEELIKASKRKDELIQNYREKSKNYEWILNDILNEVYEHLEAFERNMTAYELLPGRVKFFKNNWDIMCDKYDPLNIENEQRKKAMDNQAKMIQDLKKERDELTEKLKKVNDEINLLNSKLDKLGEYYRTDEKLIDNIQKVVFPQEEGSDYTYGYEEILNKVKELNSKVETLDKRNTNQSVIIGEKGKQIEELTRRYNMIAKKLNDIHDILKEDPNNE